MDAIAKLQNYFFIAIKVKTKYPEFGISMDSLRVLVGQVFEIKTQCLIDDHIREMIGRKYLYDALNGFKANKEIEESEKMFRTKYRIDKT